MVDSASPTDSSTWGYLTTSNIEALVTTAVSYMQSEVTEAKTSLSTLTTTRALMNDLKNYLSSLDTVAEQLAGVDSDYTFGAADTATSSSTSVLTASVGTGAASAEYNIDVTSLAKAHSISSKQYSRTAEALGLSGAFYIGGAAAAETAGATTDSSVTAYGTAAAAEGLTQLGSGDYFVEFRQSGSTWQFRVVDATGATVKVNRSDGTTGTTENWQSFSNVAGTTFDTGRGLTVTFGSEPTATKYFDDASPLGVTYTAQGAAITVEATDTLADIKSAINAASYAEGNEVQASLVSGRLVLTAADTGLAHQIAGEDSSGTVLQSLELFGVDGSVTHQLQAASDAVFTINESIQVQRSSNTGLTDVIEGLTLNVTGQGSTTLTVSTSTANQKSKVQEFITGFNTALGYLRAKTGLTLNAASTSTTTNATYTRGALAGDSLFTTLKQRMYAVVTNRYDEGTLSDLGITINSSSLMLEISDASALTSALSDDPEATKALLQDVASALNDVLDPYVEDSTDSIMAKRIVSMDDQISTKNDKISDMNAEITSKSESLREQYYQLQQMYLDSLLAMQEWVLFGGSTTYS
ncbi:MAG: flagellar filament capping protein FliD [Anaerolineae bacterium]